MKSIKLPEGRAPCAALPFDAMLNGIGIGIGVGVGVGIGIAENCLALPLVLVVGQGLHGTDLPCHR